MIKFNFDINKKVLLGFTALIFAGAFIVISSFFPLIIDPNTWKSKEFLSNELIIVAIGLFSMVATIVIGQSSNARDNRSEIARSKVKFVEQKEKVTNITRFNRWIKQVLQTRDIQTIKEREMRLVGIEDYTVINLKKSEILNLKQGSKVYNGKTYQTLTSKQIKTVLALKEGKFTITLVEPTYYLTVKAVDSERTITERSGSEDMKKTVLISWSAISKSLITIITTMILAALVRDTASKVDTAEACSRFISRMFTMVSNSFMGYIIGCQINDIDAGYINMRSLVIQEYLQDLTFELPPAKKSLDSGIEALLNPMDILYSTSSLPLGVDTENYTSGGD